MLPSSPGPWQFPWREKNGIQLHGKIEGALALKEAGFDAVSLSNNHFLDGGEVSVAVTVRELELHGIGTTGVVFGHKQTYRKQTPLIIELEPKPKIPSAPNHGQVQIDHDNLGSLRNKNQNYKNMEDNDHNNVNAKEDPETGTSKKVKVGMLSYCALQELCDRGQAGAGAAMFEHDVTQIQVRELKKEVDVVVVIMHWGQEYRFGINQSRRRIARESFDFGTTYQYLR